MIGDQSIGVGQTNFDATFPIEASESKKQKLKSLAMEIQKISEESIVAHGLALKCLDRARATDSELKIDVRALRNSQLATLGSASARKEWKWVDRKLSNVVSSILERRFMFQTKYRPGHVPAREDTQPRKCDNVIEYMLEIERVLKIYQDSVEQAFNELVRERALFNDQLSRSTSRLREQIDEQTESMKAKDVELALLRSQLEEISAKLAEKEVKEAEPIIAQRDFQLQTDETQNDREAATKDWQTADASTATEQIEIAYPLQQQVVKALRIERVQSISIASTSEAWLDGPIQSNDAVSNQQQVQVAQQRVIKQYAEILDVLGSTHARSSTLKPEQLLDEILRGALLSRSTVSQLKSRVTGYEEDISRIQAAMEQLEQDRMARQGLVVEHLKQQTIRMRVLQELQQLCSETNPNSVESYSKLTDISQVEAIRETAQLAWLITEIDKAADQQVELLKTTINTMHDTKAAPLIQLPPSTTAAFQTTYIDQDQEIVERLQERIDTLNSQLLELRAQLKDNRDVMSAFTQLLNTSGQKQPAQKGLQSVLSRYPTLHDKYKRMTGIIQENAHLKVCLKQITQSEELWGHLDPQLQIAKFNEEQYSQDPSVREAETPTLQKKPIPPEQPDTLCTIF